jgi:hypothetical protein
MAEQKPKRTAKTVTTSKSAEGTPARVRTQRAVKKAAAPLVLTPKPLGPRMDAPAYTCSDCKPTRDGSKMLCLCAKTIMRQVYAPEGTIFNAPVAGLAPRSKISPLLLLGGLGTLAIALYASQRA